MSWFQGLLSKIFGPVEERELPELDEVLARVETLERPAYTPVVSEGDCAPGGSKLLGHPLVTKEHPWPKCGNCENRMQLFWQQDLSDSQLPHEYPQRDGLLQFFLCTSGKWKCESYEPFSKGTFIRVVPVGEGVVEDLPEGHFPAKTIVGWSAHRDFPFEGAEVEGIDLSDEEREVLADAYPREGDKVGGWPYWVQDPEYPDCPRCLNRMEYLFQVGCEDNFPYMFGDAGVGHLSFCKTHPDVMSFHWACH